MKMVRTINNKTVGLAGILVLCMAAVSLCGCTTSTGYTPEGSSDTPQHAFNFVAEYPYLDVDAKSISILPTTGMDDYHYMSGKTSMSYSSYTFNFYFDDTSGGHHTATVCYYDGDPELAIMDGNINMFTGRPFVR